MGLAPEVVEDALGAREAASKGEAVVDDAVGAGGFGRAASTASDLDAAARLLDRRQAALLREVDPQRRRAKAYGLLARNGFDPDTCREVVTAWIGSAAASEADSP
jgi:hypothetical protein